MGGVGNTGAIKTLVGESGGAYRSDATAHGNDLCVFLRAHENGWVLLTGTISAAERGRHPAILGSLTGSESGGTGTVGTLDLVPSTSDATGGRGYVQLRAALW